MKKIFFFLLFSFFINNSLASEIKLEKIVDGMDEPWSLSFINQNEALITEKSGNIIYIDIAKR